MQGGLMYSANQQPQSQPQQQQFQPYLQQHVRPHCARIIVHHFHHLPVSCFVFRFSSAAAAATANAIPNAAATSANAILAAVATPG